MPRKTLLSTTREENSLANVRCCPHIESASRRTPLKRTASRRINGTASRRIKRTAPERNEMELTLKTMSISDQKSFLHSVQLLTKIAANQIDVGDVMPVSHGVFSRDSEDQIILTTKGYELVKGLITSCNFFSL